jgi:2-keto-4-pentenoate hydratase
MTPGAIAEAVDILCDARVHGPALVAFPESCRPGTLAEAHAIQSATARRLGDSIGGFKVGATPDGGVARGALLASRIFASGARVAARAMPMLGVEAEIAFRFERDMPPRERAYAYDEVAQAVVALPAIEIVDSRFREYPNAPLLDRIADCMSNGAFVHGEPHAQWRTFDLAQLDAELTFNGRAIVRRTGGHPTKDPLLPAVALVNDLRGESGIVAGQIVTTGTYTGLNCAKPGDTAIATFHGFGGVSVTFEGQP